MRRGKKGNLYQRVEVEKQNKHATTRQQLLALAQSVFEANAICDRGARVIQLCLLKAHTTPQIARSSFNPSNCT